MQHGTTTSELLTQRAIQAMRDQDILYREIDGRRTASFASGAFAMQHRDGQISCTCPAKRVNGVCLHGEVLRLKGDGNAVQAEPVDDDDALTDDPLSWIEGKADPVQAHPVQRYEYRLSPQADGEGIQVDLLEKGLVVAINPDQRRTQYANLEIGGIERSVLMALEQHRPADRRGVAHLRGKPGRRVLRSLMAMLDVVDEDGDPIVQGEAVKVNGEWRMDNEGNQSFELDQPCALVNVGGLLGFFDGRLAPVKANLQDRVIEKIARTRPRITAEQAQDARRRMGAASYPEACLPKPVEVRRKRMTPKPRLVLDAVNEGRIEREAQTGYSTDAADVVRVAFDYEGGIGRSYADGVVTIQEADTAAEDEVRRRIVDEGGQAVAIVGEVDGDVFRFGREEGRAPGIIDFMRGGMGGFDDVVRTDAYLNRGTSYVEISGLQDMEIEDGFAQQSFGVSLDGTVDGVEGVTINLIVPLIGLAQRIPEDATDEEASAMIDAICANEEIVQQLPDGRWAVIPAMQIAEQLRVTWRVLKAMTVSGEGARLARYDLGAVALLGRDAGLTLPDSIRRLVDAYRGHVTREVPVPALFMRKPDPAQMDGLRWMVTLREAGFGGILSDEVGVGKTAQAILMICHLLETGQMDDGAIVVVPKTAIGNWISEFDKFAPGLRIESWDTDAEFRSCDAETAAGARVLLTTYPMLSNARQEDVIHGRPRTIAFFDEAQDMNNAQTAIAANAFKLEAAQKIPMSATPVENNLDEIWTLMNIANPGLMGDRKTFRKEIRKPIELGSSITTQKRLAAYLRPFLLHRTRLQAGHRIPEPEMMLHRIDLSAEERRMYETIRLSSNATVRDALAQKGFDKSRIIFLTEMTKMRQACSHPALLPGGMGDDLVRNGKHSKLDAIVRIAVKAKRRGRRFLVFSQWTGHLSLIRIALEANGISCGIIQGDVENSERTAAVNRFQEGGCDALLITLKTGGRALNIPAAHEVIIADLWWNPQVEIQAIGRTQRRGQRKKVVVHRFFVPNSVEERTLEMHKRKLGLARCIFGDTCEDVRALTEEDIESIFGI